MVVDHEIPRRDEKKTYSSFIFGSEENFPLEIFMMVFMKMRLNDLIWRCIYFEIKIVIQNDTDNFSQCSK